MATVRQRKYLSSPRSNEAVVAMNPICHPLRHQIKDDARNNLRERCKQAALCSWSIFTTYFTICYKVVWSNVTDGRLAVKRRSLIFRWFPRAWSLSLQRGPKRQVKRSKPVPEESQLYNGKLSTMHTMVSRVLQAVWSCHSFPPKRRSKPKDSWMAIRRSLEVNMDV